MAKHKLSPYAADPIKRGETVRKGKRSIPIQRVKAYKFEWPEAPAGFRRRAATNKKVVYVAEGYSLTGKRLSGGYFNWAVAQVMPIRFAPEGHYIRDEDEPILSFPTYDAALVWITIEGAGQAKEAEPGTVTVTGRQARKAAALGAAYGAGKVSQQNAALHNHQVDVYRYVIDELTKQ